jgi:hypothetical protein
MTARIRAISSSVHGAGDIGMESAALKDDLHWRADPGIAFHDKNAPHRGGWPRRAIRSLREDSKWRLQSILPISVAPVLASFSLSQQRGTLAFVSPVR